MLRKLSARQNIGEPHREWFADDYFDLYVWHRPYRTIHGFQLCCDKAGDERALTWLSTGVFRHDRVDPGESSPLDLRSPILARSCPFERERVEAEFAERASQLEPQVRELILARLAEYPAAIRRPDSSARRES